MLARTYPATPTMDRVLGLLGILGGTMIVVALLPVSLPWDTDLFNLRLVVFNAGAIAVVVGVHRRQVHAAPNMARVAAALAILANAWYIVMVVRAVARPGEIGPGDYGPFFDAAAAAMWLADAWFGFVTFRLAVMHRWVALGLGFGSLLALAGMSRLGLVSGDFGWILEPLALFGIALMGVAWILLGAQLIAQPGRSPERPAAAG